MNTLDWLTRLVAYDTTSRNSNLELIHDVEKYVKQFGMITRITHAAKEKKANLFATLPASDGSFEGGIILSGHTDVVPVDDQEWHTNPFQAVQIDDKVFGRGTCDMKGFIAVVLGLLPEFQNAKLKHPIHFAFSYDEEIGCRGAPLLIEDLMQAGIKPSACIVGEPTLMQPVVAHKGIQVYRCRIHGQAVHSSLTPQGCNAIEYAAELICFIRRLADQIKNDGPFDQHFDVPFTSVSTNMIKGGTAVNIIPELCEFYFEFRNLPKVNPRELLAKISQHVQQTLLPKMQKEQTQTAIEIDNIAVAPSFETSADADIERQAREITGITDIRKVAYATEAGLFEEAHIPTIVCGPGSIEQAHRPNEFVSVEQLLLCEDFLRRVVSVS